jgi:hypothetical protein
MAKIAATALKKQENSIMSRPPSSKRIGPDVIVSELASLRERKSTLVAKAAAARQDVDQVIAARREIVASLEFGDDEVAHANARVAKAQAVLSAALDAVVIIDRQITEAQARDKVSR